MWQTDGSLANLTQATAAGAAGCAAGITYCFNSTKYVIGIVITQATGEIQVNHDRRPTEFRSWVRQTGCTLCRQLAAQRWPPPRLPRWIGIASPRALRLP